MCPSLLLCLCPIYTWASWATPLPRNPRRAEKIAGDPQKILPGGKSYDLKKWPEKFFKNDPQNFSKFSTFTK